MKLFIIILVFIFTYLYIDDGNALDSCQSQGYTLNECTNKLGY